MAVENPLHVGADSYDEQLDIACQDVKPDKTIDMIWRCKPGHFLIAEEDEVWIICTLFESLKR